MSEGRDINILEALFTLDEPRLRSLIRGVCTRTEKLKLRHMRFTVEPNADMPREIIFHESEYDTETLYTYLSAYGLGHKVMHPYYLLLLKVLALNGDEATEKLNDLAANNSCGQWSSSESQRSLCDCVCALIRCGARYTGSAVDRLPDLPPIMRQKMAGLVADRNAIKPALRLLRGFVRYRRRMAALPAVLIDLIAKDVESMLKKM